MSDRVVLNATVFGGISSILHCDTSYGAEGSSNLQEMGRRLRRFYLFIFSSCASDLR